MSVNASRERTNYTVCTRTTSITMSEILVIHKVVTYVHTISSKVAEQQDAFFYNSSNMCVKRKCVLIESHVNVHRGSADSHDDWEQLKPGPN